MSTVQQLHKVPPQLQGKPAQPNPDPGIASPYSSKAKDDGIVSAMKPVQELDKGMILQYPPSLKPPNSHPATPGLAPKTNNTR
jgi:hypothetical protein